MAISELKIRLTAEQVGVLPLMDEVAAKADAMRARLAAVGKRSVETYEIAEQKLRPEEDPSIVDRRLPLSMSEVERSFGRMREARHEALVGDDAEQEELKNEGERVGKDVANATDTGFFNQIKEGFGAKSTAGQILKMVKGAGALAAVGLGTRIFEHWAKDAEEIATKFRLGEMNASSMADALIRSVPVIGKLWSGGASLLEVLSGSNAAAEKLHRQMEARAQAEKVLAQLREPGKVADEVGREHRLRGASADEKLRDDEQERHKKKLESLESERKTAKENMEAVFKAHGKTSAMRIAPDDPGGQQMMEATRAMSDIEDELRTAERQEEQIHQDKLSEIATKSGQERIAMITKLDQDAYQEERDLKRQQLKESGKELEAEIMGLRQAAEEKIAARRREVDALQTGKSEAERKGLDTAFAAFETRTRGTLADKVQMAIDEDMFKAHKEMGETQAKVDERLDDFFDPIEKRGQEKMVQNKLDDFFAFEDDPEKPWNRPKRDTPFRLAALSERGGLTGVGVGAEAEAANKEAADRKTGLAEQKRTNTLLERIANKGITVVEV